MVVRTTLPRITPRSPCRRISRTTVQSAVELRLCEKRVGQLQDLVGAAQLLDFALEILEALCFGRGDAST